MELFIEIIKKLFFFLLMPIYVPLSLLMNATFDWWMNLSANNKFLFIVLMPFYAPANLFLLWSFEWWVKLAE